MPKKKPKKLAKKPIQLPAFGCNPWVLSQILAQENPKPASISNPIRQALAIGFSGAARPIAATALKRYCGPETTRVHRAVLVLSGGDRAELERMVDEANRDFRDVLAGIDFLEGKLITASGNRDEFHRVADRWLRFGFRVPIVVITPE